MTEIRHAGWQANDPAPKHNPLPARKARQREVFPTGEIPHKWAHQTQAQARNPQGNLYFRGPVIYSYRDSWPLACIYLHTKRGKIVLANSDRYSVTTGQHQYAVERAVPGNVPIISVPEPVIDVCTINPEDSHKANLAYLRKVAADHLAAARRVLSVRAVEWRRDAAETRLENAADYMRFFGIRGKAPVFPSADWAAAIDRAQRIEQPDPVRDAAKFRAREQRAAKRAAVFEIKRQQWRGPSAPELDLWRMSPAEWRQWHALPVMLRVNGDEIQTSQGARIPLAHAARLWRAIQAVRASGQPYQHNGHSIHAGDYRVDRIDVDGTLRAGCHVIPYAELQLLAGKLGLTSEGQS